MKFIGLATQSHYRMIRNYVMLTQFITSVKKSIERISLKEIEIIKEWEKKCDAKKEDLSTKSYKERGKELERGLLSADAYVNNPIITYGTYTFVHTQVLFKSIQQFNISRGGGQRLPGSTFIFQNNLQCPLGPPLQSPLMRKARSQKQLNMNWGKSFWQTWVIQKKKKLAWDMKNLFTQ